MQNTTRGLSSPVIPQAHILGLGCGPSAGDTMHVLGVPLFSTTPGQLVFSSVLPDHSLLPSCFALTLSLSP